MPESIGGLLLVAGLLVAAIGLVMIVAALLPWLGRLPGDLVVRLGSLRLYLPIATCVLLSLMLTAVLWLVRQFLF